MGWRSPVGYDWTYPGLGNKSKDPQE
jgi:hypothetical protein